MWCGTKNTHHQNVSIQSRDTKSTKNHQSKVELQERINNVERERERERERESIHLFQWAKYGLNGRENIKFL